MKDKIQHTSLLDTVVEVMVEVNNLTREQWDALDAAAPYKSKMTDAEQKAFADARSAAWPRFDAKIRNVYLLDGTVWYTLEPKTGALFNRTADFFRIKRV
jgi:hypothetical protein